MSHKSKFAKNRKKNEKTQLGAIRIIAGKWRGRKLPVHDLQGLRPTTDRVKETLFNWLSPYLLHSQCLDLFTGSGSLSFEALSRGAKHVDMVELDQQAAKQLQNNLAALDCQQAQVHCQNALEFIKRCGAQYDLVFIDPPFRKDLLEPCLELLHNKELLKDQALIYIEREKEHTELSLPIKWQLLKSKHAGQVCFELYQLTK